MVQGRRRAYERRQPVDLERGRVNLYNVLGFAVIAFICGGNWWQMKGNQDRMDLKMNELQVQLDRLEERQRIYDVESSQSSTARISLEKAQTKIETMIDNVNSKLDRFGDGLAEVKSDVRLLAAASSAVAPAISIPQRQ